MDYRALSKQIVKDRYLLLRIDDLIDRLCRARYFTTTRLGFWISVDRDEEYKYSQNCILDSTGVVQISGYAICGDECSSHISTSDE